MVKYEDAIKKPFTDFGRLVIGILLSIVPIVNWIARGFTLECSGVGKYKPSKNMPEWKDMGDYFVKGFLSYVVAFVYMIPAIIVFLVTAGFATASLTSLLAGTGVLNTITSSQAIGQEIRMIISENWAEILPVLATIAPLVLLGLVLLALALYMYPIAVLNYLKNKRFGKAFDVSFVAKKAFTVNYFVAWIIAGIIYFAISAVLSALPILGDAIAFFISGVIAWDLFGQVFREKQ